MAATRIDFEASDGDAPSPYVPLGGEVAITAVPNDNVSSFRWRVTGGLEIVGSDRGRSVRLAGDRVDAQIGDSTVSVTVDGILTAFYQLTVVSVDRLVAVVTSTPPTSRNTARAAMQLIDPAPMRFVSENNRRTFSKSDSLIMVGGQFPAVTVQAQVRPPGVPLVWSSTRDTADGEGTDGLMLSSTSGTEITFSTAATGAYFIDATVDVRAGISTSAPAMFKALPVVLIGVTRVTDSSRFTKAFKPDSEIGDLRLASEGFTECRKARSFIYASGENFAEFKATIEVVSGGADGRLFLSDLKAAWIQTERGPSRASSEVVGTYANSSLIQSALSATTFAAGRTYAFNLAIRDPLSYPLPDSGDDSSPPRVARARRSPVVNEDGKGETWTLTGEDLPNVAIPLAFGGGDPIWDSQPGDEVLTKVTLDMQFSAYVALWTESAPRVFGVAYRLDWGMTGTWDVTVVPDQKMSATEAVTPDVSSNVVTPNPVQAHAADTQGAEVLGPGNIQHLVLALKPPN